MAQITNELLSYGDSASREDVVMNAIEILTATENQIFNMLGKTTAINTVHAYLTDTLATAGSLAVAEQDEYSASALTTPSRLTNLVEIVAKNYKVSRTTQEIEKYHGRNELQRQTSKALLEWANAAEFDLVRSTLVSGVSGATPKLSGIIEATSKSTNHTTQTSGTVWSASILDGLMRANWDNSNGDVATHLFMGSFLRLQTDYFIQKTNMVVNTGSVSTIVRTVMSYQTASGTVNVHTHRYVQQSSDSTAQIIGLAPDKLKIAFLTKPYIDTELARTGDYDNRAVVGKFTLEVHNQDSNWFANGYLKS